MNPIQLVVNAVGGQSVAAKMCGLSTVAIHKWMKKGVLPRTEYTGKTNYAETLTKATQGRFTKDWLLGVANPDKQ